MNKFKFHNVGQGLFYTGSLMHGAYNFVFDCGSLNKSIYLNHAIQKFSDMLPYANGRKFVDFIVISHLHKDHFSGLYDLLQKVDVGTLYLPYLGSDNSFIKFALAYAIFSNSIDVSDDDILFHFMENLYINRNFAQEYGIEKIVYYGEDYSEFECENYKNVISIACKEIWEFSLYYRAINSTLASMLSTRIKTELRKFNPNSKDYTNETIIEFVKSSNGVLRQMAKDYEEIFGQEPDYKLCGELNITSAILVHKPLYRNLCAYYSHKNSKLQSNKTITVLTGDAFMDDGYSKFWNDINDTDVLLLQIPHHGAHENWQMLENKSIYSRDIDIFIIPFGLGNNHKHPHVDTIDNLVKHNCEFYNVTQLEPFEYIID